MIRGLLILALLGAPAALRAADDLKVVQLEQDVRDLQRQVQALSRQIDSMRSMPTAPPAGVPRREVGARRPEAPGWVDAAKWRRVQPGMSELQVLEVLGAPTSMRNQGGGRLLLYALEIGAGGFLGGSVTLRDGSVTAVQVPRLQ